MRTTYILIFSLVLIFPLYAQETTKGPAETINKEDPETNKDTEKKKPLSQKSPDTFKPSEKISEDLSVSFPVDI